MSQAKKNVASVPASFDLQQCALNWARARQTVRAARVVNGCGGRTELERVTWRAKTRVRPALINNLVAK